jgi:hypothetical protein
MFRCLGLPGEKCQRSTRRKFELCYSCKVSREMQVRRDLREGGEEDFGHLTNSKREISGEGPIPSEQSSERECVENKK